MVRKEQQNKMKDKQTKKITNNFTIKVCSINESLHLAKVTYLGDNARIATPRCQGAGLRITRSEFEPWSESLYCVVLLVLYWAGYWRI